MRHPRTSSDRRRPVLLGEAPRRKGRIVLLAVALLAVAAVVVVRFPLRQTAYSYDRDSLSVLWEAGRYGDLIETTGTILMSAPSDPTALLYLGLGSFYRGIGLVDQQRRSVDLDVAVESMRRLALVAPDTQPGLRDYILGKAYYHKGRHYSDVAALALGNSIAAGYVRTDSYEYLGLSLRRLGRLEEALDAFLVAAQERPSDILSVTIADIYTDLQRYDEAERFLAAVVRESTDPYVLREARLKLAGVLVAAGRPSAARLALEDLLLDEPGFAEAHFQLGEVLLQLEQPVEARSEWREALLLDPTHEGAVGRLSE